MAKFIENLKVLVCLPVTVPVLIGLLWWTSETEAGRKWAAETLPKSHALCRSPAYCEN